MTDERKIKELASDNVLMSAYLILQEAEVIKARLALELQAARDDRKAHHREFQEFIAELWQMLRDIQSQFRIEAQLLNLIRPQEAGEKKEWQEKDSSHARLLNGFAKRGS